jgi:hypothetical protein
MNVVEIYSIRSGFEEFGQTNTEIITLGHEQTAPHKAVRRGSKG